MPNLWGAVPSSKMRRLTGPAAVKSEHRETGFVV